MAKRFILNYVPDDLVWNILCLFVNNANIWWLLYSSRVSSSGCFCGVRAAHFVYVVLVCVVTFWVPCCHVRYDFHIKTVFGSSFPPVVCRRAYVFTLFMFCLFACGGVQHILCRVFLLFFFVLCALCCRCLRIIHFWLIFRYSLTFIFIDSSLFTHI